MLLETLLVPRRCCMKGWAGAEGGGTYQAIFIFPSVTVEKPKYVDYMAIGQGLREKSDLLLTCWVSRKDITEDMGIGA